MKIINVKLKKNSYPIVFSNDYTDLITFLNKFFINRKLFIISDSNVSKLYLKYILNVLKKEKFLTSSYIFKAGEKSKNIKELYR